MDVCPHGQHPKKSAQDILALCDPGNRFHMERVQRKQGGDKRAPPEAPGHPLQKEKQQQRICKVKQKVGQMMAAGV